MNLCPASVAWTAISRACADKPVTAARPGSRSTNGIESRLQHPAPDGMVGRWRCSDRDPATPLSEAGASESAVRRGGVGRGRVRVVNRAAICDPCSRPADTWISPAKPTATSRPHPRPTPAAPHDTPARPLSRKPPVWGHRRGGPRGRAACRHPTATRAHDPRLTGIYLEGIDISEIINSV